MIDLHTHILPGVDDGAPDMETTVAMLAIAQADGVTAMAATPHANDRYAFNPDRCRATLDCVRQRASGGPVLYSGCEVQLNPETLESILFHPSLFTLNHSDCLLVELPQMAAGDVIEKALQRLVERGLRPIIAHPERHAMFQRDPGFANRLIRAEVYFQITASTLTGSFGADARQTTFRLLKNRTVHFVASDAHGVHQRRPLLSAAREEVARILGASAADLLFFENPSNALTGGAIRPIEPRASLFTFWRPQADRESVRQYPAK